ncbi:hypothetical protein ATJ88_0408 [Isoptericola jiangsuensis]|uniref:Uncharacterized protein n=1 Tax=Isoptericola jiangsuensis TaxID=548579 RepID=A0A2A9ET66_9MICO|nr:hypothetical protein [Isoptericola jiangsuensis]PFG41766.1 hypothetical protein ATJ88_0408 [Isoptericola jiangsuensis]
MSYVQALVPAEHASNHVLVLPGGIEPDTVKTLAEAWFGDVRWLREPAAAVTTRPMTGARFRGIVAAEPAGPAAPGVLGVGAEHGLAGPFPVTADASPLAGLTGPAVSYALGRVDGNLDQRGGRPATPDDRDGISRAFATGLPDGEELRLVQWGVAVARHLAGALLADGRQLLRPDPASPVDLSLYSPHPVATGDLLALLRAQVATADVDPAGPAGQRLVARTPYDGSVVVTTERVDRVPRALAAVDWREYGPHVVRVVWQPQDPYELQVEQPSGLHAIARARMRAMVARLVLALHVSVGGMIVDDDAFVATTADVERRTVEQQGVGRAWI